MLDTVAYIPLQAAAPVEPPPDVGLLTAEFVPTTTPIAHAWDAQIAQLRDLSVAKKAMGAADRKWRQSLHSPLPPRKSGTEQSALGAEQAGASSVVRRAQGRTRRVRKARRGACLCVARPSGCSPAPSSIWKPAFQGKEARPSQQARHDCPRPKKIEPSISKH